MNKPSPNHSFRRRWAAVLQTLTLMVALLTMLGVSGQASAATALTPDQVAAQACAVTPAKLPKATPSTTTSATTIPKINMDQIIPNPGCWTATFSSKLRKANLYPQFCGFAMTICFVLTVLGMMQSVWVKHSLGGAFKMLIIGALCTASIADLRVGGPLSSIPNLALTTFVSAYNSSNKAASAVFGDQMNKDSAELAKAFAQYIANTTIASRSIASINFAKITQDSGANSQVVSDAMSQARKSGDAMAASVGTQSWVVIIAYIMIISLFMVYAGIIFVMGATLVLSIFVLPFAVAVIPLGSMQAVQKLAFTWLGTGLTAAIIPFVFLGVTNLAFGLPQHMILTMVKQQNLNANEFATKYAAQAASCKNRATFDISRAFTDQQCTQTGTFVGSLTELGKEGINIMLIVILSVVSFVVGLGIAGAVLKQAQGQMTGVIGGMAGNFGGLAERSPLGKIAGAATSAVSGALTGAAAAAGAARDVGRMGGGVAAAGIGGMQNLAATAGELHAGYKNRGSGQMPNIGKANESAGAAGAGTKTGDAGQSKSAGAGDSTGTGTGTAAKDSSGAAKNTAAGDGTGTASGTGAANTGGAAVESTPNSNGADANAGGSTSSAPGQHSAEGTAGTGADAGETAARNTGGDAGLSAAGETSGPASKGPAVAMGGTEEAGTAGSSEQGGAATETSTAGTDSSTMVSAPEGVETSSSVGSDEAPEAGTVATGGEPAAVTGSDAPAEAGTSNDAAPDSAAGETAAAGTAAASAEANQGPDRPSVSDYYMAKRSQFNDFRERVQARKEQNASGGAGRLAENAKNRLREGNDNSNPNFRAVRAAQERDARFRAEADAPSNGARPGSKEAKDVPTNRQVKREPEQAAAARVQAYNEYQQAQRQEARNQVETNVQGGTRDREQALRDHEQRVGAGPQPGTTPNAWNKDTQDQMMQQDEQGPVAHNHQEETDRVGGRENIAEEEKSG